MDSHCPSPHVMLGEKTKKPSWTSTPSSSNLAPAILHRAKPRFGSSILCSRSAIAMPPCGRQSERIRVNPSKLKHRKNLIFKNVSPCPIQPNPTCLIHGARTLSQTSRSTPPAQESPPTWTRIITWPLPSSIAPGRGSAPPFPPVGINVSLKRLFQIASHCLSTV